MLTKLSPLMVVLLPCSIAIAHHSQGAYYDTSTWVEIEGRLVESHWRNPHMRFRVQTEDAGGTVTTWDVEATSLSLIRQLGLEPGFISDGERVKIAGRPGRRSQTSMYAMNILGSDGSEYLLSGSATPRWTVEDELSPAEVANAKAKAVADDDAAGIFRTWSTVMGPASNRLWEDDYPLTDWAQEKLAAWDPVADNPTLRCEPKGFPTIMDAPYPVQLVDQGDIILFRQEEFDTVRTIYMGETHADRDVAPNIYGHSIGRWEDDTLVFETVNSSWPFFDNEGAPQTGNTFFVERFRLSEDGTQLNYTLTASDSEVFSKPVTLDRVWIWRPDVEVKPFNCTL